MSDFKLTYATMFNPPEELHEQYDKALKKVKASMGKEHGLYINGGDILADEKFEDRSPINTNWVLALMQKGSEKQARAALDAAHLAFPKWSHTPWKERVKLLRKVASLIEERIFELSAALSLEVGKNRMEALGDVQETADLIAYACDQMEQNNGFIIEMGKDPLVGFSSNNVSILRPYGVWLVISPFNFPFALTGGPMGAALVTGNTVVVKPASDTPWIVRLLIDCFRDSGIPNGVVNFVTGSGRTLGQALITCSDVDGATFTGSFDVGMKIHRDFSDCRWLRPVILELGGKNPTIVSRHADLERASTGIIRSAFGLQGQKCSACSRVYVEEPVHDELVERLVNLTNKIVIGDPTDRKVWMGPVINKTAYEDYQRFVAELSQSGKLLTGGKVLTDGDFSKGYFVTPTLVTNLPLTHRLWKHEMFLPITTIAKVSTIDEGMKFANDADYGLTAGFFGSEDEAEWFFDHIQAGVTYANRPQGATTGAWPGFQPFGGWKGSGASGKNAGGRYYLQLYMREQIRTLIK